MLECTSYIYKLYLLGFILRTSVAISGVGAAYPSGAPEFTPNFSGVRVTRSFVLCVCFVDRSLSFCTFYFGHCVVCSSSIYGFWLPPFGIFKLFLLLYHIHTYSYILCFFSISISWKIYSPCRVKPKTIKLDFCCFFTKHAVIRSKRKGWLARNRDNMPEWSDLSTRWLLCQWASNVKILIDVLV